MSRLTSPFSSQHPPASQHGEEIEAFSPVFLNRHGYAHRHPALGLIGWDADGFIRWNPRQAAHVLDIRLSEILPGRCPLALFVFIPPIDCIIEGEDSLFDKVWVLTGELCDKILPPFLF